MMGPYHDIPFIIEQTTFDYCNRAHVSVLSFKEEIFQSDLQVRSRSGKCTKN